MSAEYGVEWRYSDGRTTVSAGYTQRGAESMVGLSKLNGFEPSAVQVMRLDGSDWAPLTPSAERES